MMNFAGWYFSVLWVLVTVVYLAGYFIARANRGS